jgi:tetratricopeptide (TPR) repeat protein
LTILAVVTMTMAQSKPIESPRAALGAEDRQAAVEAISEMLETRYVFPDIAVRCGEHLRGQLQAGEFDGLDDPTAFAERLTESLQSVSNDKHMRVRVRQPGQARMQAENPARDRAEWLDRQRRENWGFTKVERLEGNVGYLDMRHFAGSPLARDTAASAMNFLANSDAVIFDMRKNGGGSPEMIRFVTSWLFDEPTHLNSLYWREGDRTEEFWTLEEIPGKPMADVPVFVLTSGYTFSGAEEFSYNLKTRKRATIVGETTGGGANPGGSMPVNERFAIFIPTGRAINPITGTNWEGVGVKPDVAVSADEAYDVALEKAREAAKARREKLASNRRADWDAFAAGQKRARDLAGRERHAEAAGAMAAALKSAVAADLIGEMDVNMLGYEHLQRDLTDLAIAIFSFNVEAFPESPNVYDSLGEAYMVKGDTALAIRSYRRSLELDPENHNAEQMIATMQSQP